MVIGLISRYSLVCQEGGEKIKIRTGGLTFPPCILSLNQQPTRTAAARKGELMIRFDRLTIKAQEALAEAQKLAEKAGHQQLDVEHLALALMRQREGLTQSLLNKLGADPTVLARELEQELKKIPQVSGSGATGVAGITPRLRDAFSAAEQEAERFKDEYLSTEHLLLAIVDAGGTAAGVFKRQGVSKDRLYAALTSIRGTQRVTDQEPEGKYQALAKYSRDLTDLARKGKLDPVIGRDEEIRRVIRSE